jgi:hypothetical protein
VVQSGHDRDCAPGTLYCGNFIFKDLYEQYLQIAKTERGLTDGQIIQLISNRYPSAVVSPYINVKNIYDVLNQLSRNTIMPIILSGPDLAHMVLIGRSNDNELFLKDQQDNYDTQNNNNVYNDRSLFVGIGNIQKYITASDYNEVATILHQNISDLTENLSGLRL